MRDELRASDLEPPKDSPDPVADLEARQTDLKARIDKLQSRLRAGGDFDEGVTLLQQLGADLKTINAQLDKAKSAMASPPAETLADAQTIADLLAKAAGDEKITLRVRLKQRIAELVDSMHLLVETPIPALRITILQIVFRKDLGALSNLVRHVLIKEVRQGPLKGYLRAVAGLRDPGVLPDLKRFKDDATVRERITSWVNGFAEKFLAEKLDDDGPDIEAARKLFAKQRRERAKAKRSK
jgi:hypothetical protein